MKTEVNFGEVLDSLTGLQKAAPRPFLSTRVKAKLLQKKETLWDKIVLLFNKPVIAFTSFVLIMAINTTILFQNNTTNELSSTTDDELIATNYDLASDLNIINIENEK
jgi:hypothetical protein